MDASRLAGVTHLTVNGRGPRDAFVFDPHRLALPCWALAGEGSLLVTLDRHFDLVEPTEKPGRGLSPLELDDFARRRLDVRNTDHVLAAMEAGVVGDVIAIARARPRGCFQGDTYVDALGGRHAVVTAPTVDVVNGQLGRTPESMALTELLSRAPRVLLDVDLDCFTTPSDADPTSVVPWTEELIRGFLRPLGSDPLWHALLEKCAVLTIAREPLHCGGVVAAGRLFETVASVLFEELLHADLP